MMENKRKSAFSVFKSQKTSNSSLENRSLHSSNSGSSFGNGSIPDSSEKVREHGKFSWKNVKKIIRTPIKKRRSSSYSVTSDSIVHGFLEDTQIAISDNLNAGNMSTISGITHRSGRESTPSSSLSRLPSNRLRAGNGSERRSMKRFSSYSNTTLSDKTFLGADKTSPQPKVAAKKRKLSKDLEQSASPDGSKSDKDQDGAEDSDEPIEDSREEAKKLFQWLIHPVKSGKFFNELWEKKPLLVKRRKSSYNAGWFSSNDLDKILKEEQVYFSENLDITSYVDGKRHTHNPVGRAFAPVVWKFFQEGCSIRLLNPQTYSKAVWKMLSVLQEYFGCMVGANVYLTPQGTQGFAPHYDDIEAFVIQLEGKKHWRLYNPRNEQEVLPRFSSGNFTDRDIGEPVLEAVLEAGDLLYFPRGIIHQADSLPDEHSLHMTVSCYQKNAWIDLLEKVVPRTLQLAAEEDVDFRRSLPLDYLNYMGVAFSDSEHPSREGFIQHVRQLILKLADMASIDAACDQMGKQFMHDSLPPMLSDEEKSQTVNGPAGSIQLQATTAIRLIKRNAIRLVVESEVTVYFSSDNARVYHGREVQGFVIDDELAPAVEHLIVSYPDFVPISELPVKKMSKKVAIATQLFEKGLLLMKNSAPGRLVGNESAV